LLLNLGHHLIEGYAAFSPRISLTAIDPA
jgi:hypothetical protein